MMVMMVMMMMMMMMMTMMTMTTMNTPFSSSLIPTESREHPKRRGWMDEWMDGWMDAAPLNTVRRPAPLIYNISLSLPT
jgi:hypothetical protein